MAGQPLRNPARVRNSIDERVEDEGLPQFSTKCTHFGPKGGRCPRPAGQHTPHEGIGLCGYHGGNSQRELTGGAWLMGHVLGRELEVTPWDALLITVRRAASHASWYASKLAEVQDDDDLAPGGASYHWVQGAERANQSLARFAKMAVDAGVAQIMVQQVTAQAMQLGQLMSRVLGELEPELDPDTMNRVRATLRRELEALDAQGWTEAPKMIEGERA